MVWSNASMWIVIRFSIVTSNHNEFYLLGKLNKNIIISSKLIKSGDIKCETKLNLDGLNLQFDIFGIELAINSELRLYPKSFKENLFTNYKINSTSGKNVSLSINSNGSNGIIIPDRTCFSKMINLFQSSKQKTILNEVKFSENKLDLIGLIVIIWI